jgi:glycosyltransferase involved in cell wall biosynthesis
LILYLGNILSQLGKSVSVIEILGPRLTEFDQVVLASGKANKFLRLTEMISCLLKHRKDVSILLIDCYSSTAFWYVVITSTIARWFNIPYIPILHGGDLPARLKKWPRLSSYVFSNSATNVSPSLYLKEHFVNAGFGVSYIPNFIELDQYQFLKRSDFKPRLLWVRAFHQIYNPTLAIDVLKLVSVKFKDASLCMIGTDKDGSLEIVKSKAQQEGVIHQLEITGYLTKEQWKQKSEEFDIFINTTNFDNMPVSVIEAMALGLPIVSTNAGGLPYLIQHLENGLLVKTDDAQGFMEAVEKIVTNPELGHKLAVNARLKVEDFDWLVVKDKWKIVIDQHARKLPGRQ